MTKIAVVALGGNALTRAGQSGTYDEMMSNAAAMATAVNDVLESRVGPSLDTESVQLGACRELLVVGL